MCGILTLFFLFYLNRLFATLVSYGIRAYTWHNFRVYVDIQALQISLLGGRIFFKGVRYHGENETVLIQSGYITWNYWLRAVKQADCARFASNDCHLTAGSNEGLGSASQCSGTQPCAKESGAVKAAQELPSRISVSISGFEWFLYNRSPAYDAIAVSQALKARQGIASPNCDDPSKDDNSGTPQKESSQNDRADTQQLKQFLTRRSTKSTSGEFSILADTDTKSQSKHKPRSPGLEKAETFSTLESRATDSSALGSRHNEHANPSPFILALLPILIECQKGAIVIGNEHTRAILTTTFERSRGHIDADKSGLRDIYRQIFEFEVTHPVVQMKPNSDYKQPQQAAAQRIIHNNTSSHTKRRWWKIDWSFSRRKRKVLHRLRTLVPYFRSSVESFQPSSADKMKNVGTGNWPNEVPGESRWLGLSRYLDENERDDHEGWSNIEYARFSNIIDCPSVHLSLYWDVPGAVVADPSSPGRDDGDHGINLAKPPAFGLDLILRGGNINYGPWADRARAEIQNAFFPNSYEDALPTDPLLVGSSRQSTVFNINVHIENEITLRLPTRESTKDWQWKGRAGALRGASGLKQQRDKKHTRKKDEKNLLGPDVRPFGWLAVSVSPNSTITYNMDMIARTQGFFNDLEFDLKGTKMMTSVNHALLWSCGPQKISCDLSNPLGWNTFHKWTFDIHSEGMELFLLRDHMFLLVDLISDFTSGPTSEFLTFVPFSYCIKLSFTNIKLYLNANDSNIIDTPCDLEENTFLILHGETLDARIDIPLDDYAPSENRITFRARARDARLDVATPIWNTAHTFSSDVPTATLKDFSMDGCYTYCSSTSSSLTDSLFLNLGGFSPRVFLHGSVIKYCIKLKDNYFGDDMHFRTLEEYQNLLSKPKDVQTEPSQFQVKKDNDLDVILNVTFEQVCVLLPANIYSRKENLRLEFLLIEAGVRFTNYYMDLEAKSSPIEAAWESVETGEVGTNNYISRTQAFVDGIGINGHRLFGSAPSEPTYVCNWDFDVGKVTGECSTDFMRIVLQAMRSFSFTLDDDENALPQTHIPMIHDVTFLSVRIGNINLWFSLEETAILFATEGIEIEFNDWAGKRFSERLYLEIPDIRFAAVDQKSAIRHRDQMNSTAPTHALIHLSLMLRMTGRQREFPQKRELQQQHVKFHDQRTHRASWLLHNPYEKIQPHEHLRRTIPKPPAMPIPHMPAPLSRQNYISSAQSMRLRTHNETSSPRLRRKISFFSEASSHHRPSSRPRKNVSKVSTYGANQRSYDRLSGSVSRDMIEDNEEPATLAIPAASKKHIVVESKIRPNPKSTLTYSSPWTAPYFPLQKIVPDTGHLPDKPYGANSAMNNKMWCRDAPATFEHLDEDNKAVLTMFDVDLGTDVRGFASPKFFAAVAALLKALEPVQPADLLDDLQIGTMSQIRKTASSPMELGQTTDYCIRIPSAHIRIVDSDSPWQPPSNETNRDQYDLQVVGCKVTARSVIKQKHVNTRPNVKSGACLHVVLTKSLLEIHDRSSDVLKNEAAVTVSIEDVVLSMASDEQMKARFQQRDLQVTSWGNRVEYLASLVYRTVDMSKFIMSQFTPLYPATRIQSLVYHLTDVAGSSTDPMLLSKPSYVLRIADDHLRLNDSWKIASRLRNMLRSLNVDQQLALLQHCASSETSLPSNAEALVLANFDNWRSWDLAHVKKSLIMETVWHHSTSTRSSRPHNRALLLELALGKARFSLDPGPKENQIDIHGVSMAISTMDGPSYGLNPANGDVVPPRIVMVQSCCSRFGMHLNWELMVLISNAMELSKSKNEISKQPSLDSTKNERPVMPVQQLHVVVGMDVGMFTLKSINVTVTMAASAVRGSILHRSENEESKTISTILTSRSTSAKLEVDEKVVLGWLLDNATMCLSKASILSRNADRAAVMKATAKCEILRFEMREELSNSLETANRILKDEVNFIKGLASQFSASNQPGHEKKHSDNKNPTDIHIALFLNQYALSVAILPLLTYVISGKVVRTLVVPRTSPKVAINFDSGNHTHAFKLKSKDRDNEVAVLNMPPINSRVIVSRSTKLTKIDTDTTLNKVELDARSVRSCIDMVNKPEVVRALINAKKNAQQASAQLHALFSSKPDMVAETSSHSTAFLYAANVTLIGLGVHVSAPALKSKDCRADLDFVLGLTTVHLGNEDVDQGAVHDRPQFDVAFRRISLNIYRQSHGTIIKSGNFDFSGRVTGITGSDKENQIRVYKAASDSLDVNLGTRTASLVVDIAAHLQERIMSFTLADEVKGLKPLRRLTVARFAEAPTITVTTDDGNVDDETASDSLFDSVYSLELSNIKIAWRLDAGTAKMPSRPVEDLVFSIQKANLNTKREGSATLAITELHLQMVPKSLEVKKRSLNSALLPDVVFKVAYLSTKRDRRLAFQAAGKALDLRLASDFIVPATALRASLAAASAELREGSAIWAAQPMSSRKNTSSLFGSKFLASLLIDADFAGAVVTFQASGNDEDPKSVFGMLKGDKRSRAGRYDQVVQGDDATQATLRAPGVAMKVEYAHNGREDPALNAEIKVAASSNVLYPSVVPLIIEVSSSIKEIVGSPRDSPRKPMARRKSEIQKSLANPSLASSDPANLMGRCKLNLGLWIREQDFSLSCQPIARVAATARCADTFIAVNTVQSPNQGSFFALSANFSDLQASVQHVYSRESTASLEVDAIVLSMMNSKHVTDTTGVSALLNVSPMKASVNAKQLQDFLLFREIWYPAELRQAASSPATAPAAAESQAIVVQRYQQVAAVGAFPWNAVVSVQELEMQLDLGQSLGKSVFTISQLWASSKKASDFEQSLCLGLGKVSVESTGRMSGFVELQNFRVRTSIRWPHTNIDVEQTPLVQASLGMDQFRVKAAFDYQPFAVAEISMFEFFMYNIRPSRIGEKDRLVGNLEGEKVQVFCTTASASQAMGLYQAVVRLVQEKEVAYEGSLKELDRYLRRRSVFPSSTWTTASTKPSDEERKVIQGPFLLHTDVVVTLKAVNVGAFPSTFFDNQILKVEATDAQARFSVSAKEGKTHSVLGLTLGQLRIALSNVNRSNTQALGEVSVSDVVNRATSSRGGTILKVPKVVATMQTWQRASSISIDYIFKSTFEGKVDVGWNYSRISFIRRMWSTHSQALAARLGKPLPQSALQITGGPQFDEEGEGKGEEKITAVVNVPQSRFEYRALEPPIIETPQLRDMGEATPPLEWIGLHRDKLPNVTHQIVIVTLLEVAREVEDAYSKILGSA